MTFDAGRIRHDMSLMHYSRMSNGSAVPSNWRPSATGDTGVTWTPEAAGGGVSYGSNSNEVTYANAAGASTLVSRADHAHRGVTSLAHASNTYTGPVTLETEGGLYIVRSAANTYRLGSTGGSGGAGSGTLTTIEEVDGSPTDSAVTKLVFPNGTLSIAAHVATYTPTGGGGGALTLITQTILGSAASTITITGISGSYKDLIVVVRARGTDSGTGLGWHMRVGNGSIDSGSNYAYYDRYTGWTAGENTSTSDTKWVFGLMPNSGAASADFSHGQVTIMHYADTAKMRGAVGQCFSYDGSGILNTYFGGTWKNTAAAIDQVQVVASSGNFDTGSALTIYGRG